MIPFNQKEISVSNFEGKPIHVFHIPGDNIHSETVESFGEEWARFDFFHVKEIKDAGDQYFDILPIQAYKGKIILDVGCGTGRWSKYLHYDAGFIEAIDPSSAVFSAARLLGDCVNVRISRASIDNIPFADNSFDLVFSLGVLHHIPETEKALQACVKKVKPGGLFLVYLYYSLDNRGKGYKFIFYLSNILRSIVSKLPTKIKHVVCDIFAAILYLPFVLLSKVLSFLNLKGLSKRIPLSYYVDKSFRIIRNDSLDRFGTPLEQRFSKNEITKMLQDSGLTNIIFSPNEPYWHVVATKPTS